MEDSHQAATNGWLRLSYPVPPQIPLLLLWQKRSACSANRKEIPPRIQDRRRTYPCNIAPASGDDRASEKSENSGAYDDTQKEHPGDSQVPPFCRVASETISPGGQLRPDLCSLYLPKKSAVAM